MRWFSRTEEPAAAVVDDQPRRSARRVGTRETPHLKIMRTFYGWNIWQASVGQGLVAYGTSAFGAWSLARSWFANNHDWTDPIWRDYAISAADKTLTQAMSDCQRAGWRKGARRPVREG